MNAYKIFYHFIDFLTLHDVYTYYENPDNRLQTSRVILYFDLEQDIVFIFMAPKRKR